MAENKMKEVAKLLGLQLEEAFNIKGSGLTYKLTNQGLCYYDYRAQNWFYSTNSFERLVLGYDEIIKLPKPILDDIEKEYLSAVIKPFRDKVFTVSKQIYGDAHYIQIRMSTLYRNTVYEFFNLPSFKPETMYKGMELNKEYTLEELGL